MLPTEQNPTFISSLTYKLLVKLNTSLCFPHLKKQIISGESVNVFCLTLNVSSLAAFQGKVTTSPSNIHCNHRITR